MWRMATSVAFLVVSSFTMWIFSRFPRKTLPPFGVAVREADFVSSK